MEGVHMDQCTSGASGGLRTLLSGTLSDAPAWLICPNQFPLGQEPMLDIASFRTSSLQPELECPSANKAKPFQRCRLRLEFISDLVDRLQRAAVADPIL
jgi:hypothetical protein